MLVLAKHFNNEVRYDGPKTLKSIDSATLCEPHEMLTGLFDALPLGVAVMDKQLRYRAVNKALAAMNHVAPHAHLGNDT
jgi:PAS domain-containing protein